MFPSHLPRTSCNHSLAGHLTSRFFCPDQPPFHNLGKIIAVAFLFLGFYGLGRAAASLQAKFFPTTPLTSQKIPFKDYPAVGQAAIQFAREQLELNSMLQEVPFGKDYEPTNTEITKLKTLYTRVCWKNLETAIAKHASEENPWEQQEVIDAADVCMKIAYAISCLTLEDLQPFIEKFSEKDEPRWTNEDVLVRQDSYQYKTFYHCTRAYHIIRGANAWTQHPDKDKEDLQKNPFTLYARDFVLPEEKQPIPQQYAQLFYTQGKVQNTWNALYNDYCDRIRMYVLEDNLRKKDNRHISWTQKDTGPSHFISCPDTLPTGI